MSSSTTVFTKPSLVPFPAVILWILQHLLVATRHAARVADVEPCDRLLIY